RLDAFETGGLSWRQRRWPDEGAAVAEQVDAAGMPTALGPVDYLLHRGEANPRTRSGIMALELLDSTPDWDRFRTRFENASRRALRLRQKVVVPTLPPG